MIRISNNEYTKIDGDSYVYRVSDFFVIKKSTGKIYAFYKKLYRAPMLDSMETYQYLIIYPSGHIINVIISEITKFDIIFPSEDYNIYKLNPETQPIIHVMF